MKARIKPVMLTPYFPKVRTINGTEHRMSREEYRHYMRSTPEHRPQIVAEKAPKKEKINKPTSWDDVQKELFTDKEI